MSDDWYPSCVVKLTIRFDEALHVRTPRDEVTVGGLSAQSQESRIVGRTKQGTSSSTVGDPVNNAAGQHRPRRALDDVRQSNQSLAAGDQFLPTDARTPGATAIGRRGPGGAPGAEVEPLTFGTDSFTVICNRIPRKASFNLPHPRTAPTFNMTFDYTEFPIDPQLIRAVGVEIHLGSVSADDFARGMRGDTDDTGRPFSILKTTDDIVDPFTGRTGVNAGTLLFYGTVDTWDVDHGEKDSQIIMEGREVRAILIDTKYAPAHVDKIKLNQEITDVITDLIASIRFEHGFRMVVATDATEWPNGVVPSPGDVDGLTRVRVKAASMAGAAVKTRSASGADAGVATGDKEASRSAPDNGSKGSYWDLITNYCELVGAMPHIVGSMLWIRPVHRIFDIVDPSSHVATPFANGKPRVVGEEQLRVRRMVLGRNLRRLRIQRKFGGVAVVPTVQTISFDDRGVGQQRLIFGQWPPAGSPAADNKAESELLRVPMWGVRSVARLTEIARGIHEEIGRGETGGTAETDSLASLGGDNDDPDILRLRSLEPIEFVVDASSVRSALPIVSDVTDIARMSFSAEVDEIARRIGDRAVARALVALSRGAVLEVLRYYQVVGVQFEWDRGVKTSIQFQNYIVPRHSATDVSDVRAAKDVKVKTVSVPGQQKKAAAKLTKADIASAIKASGQRIGKVQRRLVDDLLTPQDRGKRGLQ